MNRYSITIVAAAVIMLIIVIIGPTDPTLAANIAKVEYNEASNDR